jgi:hypothetical protein
MAGGARLRSRSSAVPVAASLLVALVVTGFATRGPAAGLAITGLLAVLVGVLAVSLGRARWALIGSRRTAAVVALAGVLAFLLGAFLEARTAHAADSAASPFSTEQTSPA